MTPAWERCSSRGSSCSLVPQLGYRGMPLQWADGFQIKASTKHCKLCGVLAREAPEPWPIYGWEVLIRQMPLSCLRQFKLLSHERGPASKVSSVTCSGWRTADDNRTWYIWDVLGLKTNNLNDLCWKHADHKMAYVFMIYAIYHEDIRDLVPRVQA